MVLVGGYVGVVGSVDIFGDGQGAFDQRAGRGRIAEIAQDAREVVQQGGDGGVVGAVDIFGDGQGAFGQRAGRGRIAELAQDAGEVAQQGGDGGVVGWRGTGQPDRPGPGVGRLWGSRPVRCGWMTAIPMAGDGALPDVPGYRFVVAVLAARR